MYRVIKSFHDLQDVKKTKSGDVYHEYELGDEYPRKGLKPSKDRIAELSGRDNKQGVPLIELVEEEKTDKSVEATGEAKKESTNVSGRKKTSVE